MRHIGCLVFIFLTITSLSRGQTNGYCNLVWNDEFSGTQLDTTKWTKEVTCSGGGNGELQCYTPRAKNIFLEDGSLVLKAFKETYTGTQQGCTDSNGCTDTKQFTSGRVNTASSPSGSFLRGRMEVRAKLTSGARLWPAIWMLPTERAYGGWAASGEIDIMEQKGDHPYVVSGTLHHGAGWPNNVWTTTGDKTFPVDLSQSYHVYGVEWTETSLIWFVDQTITQNYNLTRWWNSTSNNPYTAMGQPWDKKFHFVLNVAVGGNFFGGYPALTDADVAAWKTTEMRIDYVRAWSKGGDCSKNPFADGGADVSNDRTEDVESQYLIATDNSPNWLAKNAIIVFPAIGGSVLVIGAVVLAIGLYFKLRNRFDVNPGLPSQPSSTQIVEIFPGSP